MRRARRQLKGPFAIAGMLLVAGCSRPADAVSAPPTAGASPAAGAIPAANAPPAGGASQAAGAPRAADFPRAVGAAPASSAVVEATCTTAPLGVRVVSVRRESPDSIRVELSLANLAAAHTWTPGSDVTAAAQAAVAALDGASVLSRDGRRRMFALRGGGGERVGSPVAVPAPGRPETFWTLFPAAEAEVSVLLPGFAPLAGLTVAPRPGQPEP